jgi:hypothetical protein
VSSAPIRRGCRCAQVEEPLVALPSVDVKAFRRALEEIGVTDVFFELFDAGHVAIEYRYPLSLKYLAERLAPRPWTWSQGRQATLPPHAQLAVSSSGSRYRKARAASVNA